MQDENSSFWLVELESSRYACREIGVNETKVDFIVCFKDNE